MEDGDSADELLALRISFAVIAALLSAMFSGLTLGLMTLDVSQLRILIDSAHPDDQQSKKTAFRAKRVMKVRKDGNWLLVTLLMGNVMVNSAFSILMGNLTSGWAGFIISTVVITLFGEIIPQAVCSRHGLPIGAFFTYPVIGIKWLFAIVAKPIALILDAALGEDMGIIYTRRQLAVLLDHHQKGNILLEEEARIMAGGLVFGQKEVQTVMTDFESVFGIGLDDRLDFHISAEIVKSGFSRIPVFKRSEQESTIVGLLLVKDLLLLDVANAVPVRTALSLFGRPLYTVDSDASCISLLSEFKKGHTHLAVVRKVVEDESGGDPYYQHLGIVTLEDILEEILQDEIFDEFEIHHTTTPTEPRGDAALEEDAVVEEPPVLHATLPMGGEDSPSVEQRVQIFHSLWKRSQLTKGEAVAVSLFLASTYECFASSQIRLAALQHLLLNQPCETLSGSEALIYVDGQAADFATVILHGKLRVNTGPQGSSLVVGAWTVLAPQALGPPPSEIVAALQNKEEGTSEALRSWSRSHLFIANFTAAADIMNLPSSVVPRGQALDKSREVRVLRITRTAMVEAMLQPTLPGPSSSAMSRATLCLEPSSEAIFESELSFPEIV